MGFTENVFSLFFLFCRNGSLGLGDSRILLEMEPVREFFRVWGGWVSLRMFINVLSLSFCRNSFLDPLDFQIFLKMEPVGESWVVGVVVVSLRMFVNILFSFFFVEIASLALWTSGFSWKWNR